MKPTPALTIGALEITELGLLRLQDRPEWERRVLAALEAAGGNRTRAAAALGVGYRQFRRWAQELGIPVVANQHAQKVASGAPRVIAKPSAKRRIRKKA